MSSKPVITVKENDNVAKVTPNLLPVSISHDGSFPHNPAHWSPLIQENGSGISYFRGRKIIGHYVKLPETHRGVLIERVPEGAGQASVRDDDVVEVTNEGKELEATMTITSEFDDVVVWGQDTITLPSEDPYARALKELTAFTTKIHEV